MLGGDGEYDFLGAVSAERCAVLRAKLGALVPSARRIESEGLDFPVTRGIANAEHPNLRADLNALQCIVGNSDGTTVVAPVENRAGVVDDVALARRLADGVVARLVDHATLDNSEVVAADDHAIGFQVAGTQLAHLHNGRRTACEAESWC